MSILQRVLIRDPSSRATRNCYRKSCPVWMTFNSEKSMVQRAYEHSHGSENVGVCTRGGKRARVVRTLQELLGMRKRRPRFPEPCPESTLYHIVQRAKGLLMPAFLLRSPKTLHSFSGAPKHRRCCLTSTLTPSTLSLDSPWWGHWEDYTRSPRSLFSGLGISDIVNISH